MTGLSGKAVSGVLFDLDGTLVNTLSDLGTAMNRSLVAQGLSPHETQEYANMIGGGMVRLVELASGGKGDQGLLLQGLLKFYGSRIVGDTRAYPGVHSLLSSLRLAGIRTGIVSNKAHGMTVDVVARIFPEAAFKVILGHRPGYLKKPDPSVLLEACDVGGMSVANTLFIGDTTVDMEAGIRAGMRPIGVSWGYHSASRLEEAGAVHILKDGHELQKILGLEYSLS